VDIIDTCMSPYAYRTSHAAIEPLVVTLLRHRPGYRLFRIGISMKSTKPEKDILPKYKHLLDDSKVSIIDTNVLLHQTPGGMLSNLANQLREMDALDRINEVLRTAAQGQKGTGPGSPGDPHQPDRRHPDRQQRAFRR
jgi:pyruvate carboxylase subunit B